MPETRAEFAIEAADDGLCYAALVELSEVAFLAPDKVLVLADCAAEREDLVSVEINTTLAFNHCFCIK